MDYLGFIRDQAAFNKLIPYVHSFWFFNMKTCVKPETSGNGSIAGFTRLQAAELHFRSGMHFSKPGLFFKTLAYYFYRLK